MSSLVSSKPEVLRIPTPFERINAWANNPLTRINFPFAGKLFFEHYKMERGGASQGDILPGYWDASRLHAAWDTWILIYICLAKHQIDENYTIIECVKRN